MSSNYIFIFAKTLIQKTSTAVAFVKEGKGSVKVNGSPIHLLQPEVLQLKVLEPFLLLSETYRRFVDIRVRVKGGGTTSQIYAIRQAISKGLVAYTQKFIDEETKKVRRIITN